jgi:CheY-like chemotaxis protein
VYQGVARQAPPWTVHVDDPPDAQEHRRSPLPKTGNTPPRNEPSGGLFQVSTQAQVLVVEDDRDTREVLKLILEMEGLDVIEAADGQEALESLHRLRVGPVLNPCVVVLDIMMPRCSGPEFRQRQLADPLLADIPVIVLSAVADQMRIEELGAFARISKPFDPDDLVDAVRRACDLPPEGA